jgi:uncharacterized membrane protein YccC
MDRLVPGSAAWRQAVRIMVAVIAAWVITEALHLRSYYWAMITTSIVVQNNLGGTLDAGANQLASTIAGGLLGMAGVWLRMQHVAPDWVILLAVLTPLALLAAMDSYLRAGPVTALIVMLITPTSGSGIDLALSRIGEIAIGSVIGVAVSLLVLPGRAGPELRRRVAEALRALGRHAAAALCGEVDEAGAAAVRAAIARAEAAGAALARERSVHLGSDLPADALLHGLSRLRADITLLRRAMGEDPAPAALAGPVRDWCDEAARNLLERSPAPGRDALAQVASALDAAHPLGFSFSLLLHDINELARPLDTASGVPS